MKNIFIVNHATEKTGSANYFEDYLLRRKYDVYRLSHPLNNYKNKKTYFLKNREIIKSFNRTDLGVLNFFSDFIISLLVLSFKKIDVFIGANNFDTFAGIVLKKLGKKINMIIFFGSDFSEHRFKNFFLDKIYMQIEKIVVRNSDFTISNTKRAEQKRISMGLDIKKSFVIPNGIFIENPLFIAKKIDKQKFVFIGSLTEEHGLFGFVQFFYKNIKELVVIGVGDERDNILKFCSKNNIKIKILDAQKHEFVINFLKTFNGFGLAPYNLKSKWTYYCSPSKVGEYIACGVPVVISAVPEIAEYVKKNKLGIIYDSFDKQEYSNLKQSILEFETDNYNKKAEEFYSKFNRDILYKKIDFLFQ